MNHQIKSNTTICFNQVIRKLVRHMKDHSRLLFILCLIVTIATKRCEKNNHIFQPSSFESWAGQQWSFRWRSGRGMRPEHSQRTLAKLVTWFPSNFWLQVCGSSCFLQPACLLKATIFQGPWPIDTWIDMLCGTGTSPRKLPAKGAKTGGSLRQCSRRRFFPASFGNGDVEILFLVRL